MEKNRGSKILAIIALLVSAVGLSLGFAAFSRTLDIRALAEVGPTKSDLKVNFSSSGEVLAIDPVVAETTSGVSATDGHIDNTKETPLINSLGASFTAPGQKVVYKFYAANVGEYDAFLKSIQFGTATGSATKTCTAKPNSESIPTQSLLDAACNDIILSVKVGDEIETNQSVVINNTHKLAKGDFEPIVVTIEYLADGARADGDFKVSFADISLVYSTN